MIKYRLQDTINPAKNKLTSLLDQTNSELLKHKVFNCFNGIFLTYNKITRCLIKGNSAQLKFVIDDDATSRSEATTLDEVKFTPKQTYKHDKSFSEPITVVNVPLENKVDPPLRRRKSICGLLKTYRRQCSGYFRTDT